MYLQTHEKIELITSSTSDIDVYTSFDRFGTTNTIENQTSKITTATTTEIVSSPGANETIRIDEITITNHGGAVNNIEIQKDLSGSNYERSAVVALQAGECYQYSIESGWSKQVTS